MHMEQWWNAIDKEKIGVLGKRVSQCHVVLHGAKLPITA